MNTALKAIFKILFDTSKSVVDALEKKDFQSVILPDIYALATDVPSLIANISTLQDELAGLSHKEGQDDLVAFITASVPSVVSDVHAKSVLIASLTALTHLITDGLVLIKAIKGDQTAKAIKAEVAPAAKAIKAK